MPSRSYFFLADYFRAAISALLFSALLFFELLFPRCYFRAAIFRAAIFRAAISALLFPRCTECVDYFRSILAYRFRLGLGTSYSCRMIRDGQRGGLDAR